MSDCVLVFAGAMLCRGGPIPSDWLVPRSDATWIRRSSPCFCCAPHCGTLQAGTYACPGFAASTHWDSLSQPIRDANGGCLSGNRDSCFVAQFVLPTLELAGLALSANVRARRQRGPRWQVSASSICAAAAHVCLPHTILPAPLWRVTAPSQGYPTLSQRKPRHGPCRYLGEPDFYF